MSTRIEVHGGAVTITFDGGTTVVQADRMTAFAQVVEAARLLATSGAEDQGSAAAAPKAPRQPSKKRRSRKKVSELLSAWMQDNPGWHSEKALLETVKAHGMTDANPKRALMIALGRQRNKVFADSGNGHWRLLTDTSAGKAPRARRKAKKGGRKKTTKAASRKKASDSPRPSGAETGRVVRIKKGDDRKLAPLSEDAKRQRLAPSKLQRRPRRVSQDAVNRAAQNPLGMPGAGTIPEP